MKQVTSEELEQALQLVDLSKVGRLDHKDESAWWVAEGGWTVAIRLPGYCWVSDELYERLQRDKQTEMISVSDADYFAALVQAHQPRSMSAHGAAMEWRDTDGRLIAERRQGGDCFICRDLYSKLKDSKMTAHKHAESMRLYAEDAAQTDRPWERWQSRFGDGSWRDMVRHPKWWADSEYRRKARTVIFCGQELPAPETEAPKYGATYWMPDITMTNYALDAAWLDSNGGRQSLKRGLVHLSRDAARQWGRAIATAIREATHA